VLTCLIIAGLCNLVSISVFIHFEEYWICFCARERSKCMLKLSL